MNYAFIWFIVISAALASAEGVSFSREVAPILQQQCVACHKEGKAKGKYRLDTYEQLRKELDPGDLETELFHRITTDDVEDRMPVDADPLENDEIGLIRRWIVEGAIYDGEDPQALLSSIIPQRAHPSAPATYPRPLGVTAMVFGQEGRRLYTGGYHEILVWDPDSGALLDRIPDNGQRSYGLALSPDGKTLAAATGAPGQAGEVRIFDSRSGRVLATPFRGDDTVLAIGFSPDGKVLAFGGVDGKLRLFETGKWTALLEVGAHSDWLTALSWRRDGKQIATASRDKTAKVHDVTTGKRVSTFSGHPEAVRAITFHPNGGELLSTGDHGHLFLWRSEDGKKVADRARFEGAVLRLVEADHGFFATTPGGVVVQFNPKDQKRLQEFKVAPQKGAEAPTIASCASWASLLAVGARDGRVAIFDAETGEQRAIFMAKP